MRRRGPRVALSKVALVVGWLLASPTAYANPTGGQVAAGSAVIANGAPGTLNIFQASDRAIMNWQTFGIGVGETVNFLQPTARSVVLNRVLGNDPSAIFGQLNANGTVMLVNPNGIVFGPTARVDVGGLVASTANIRDDDFMAGRYFFGQPSSRLNASVENHGHISIQDSGLAALVAPRVRNSGVIEARLGRVALGAAHSFTLDFHGDGLLSFGAGSAISEAPAGGGALVTNSGEIRADGGSVLLTARAVKGVIDQVINTDGLISATTVSGENGRIVLSGGDAGTVAIGGRVDASASAGGQGGSVVATGERVSVAAGTQIDASGRHGGGEIALGSTGLTDAANPYANKSGAVNVDAGATLNADATEHGHGGQVTLWSKDETVFQGAISARGGAQGGDGGFAEVSSLKNIGIAGEVDLSAAKGATGTFLIDPTDLRITDTDSGGTQNANAADGTVSAGDANQGAGATLNTLSRGLLESLSGNANIVLQATGQITIDAMAGGAVNFQTVAGRSVTLQSTQTGGIHFVDANTELRTQGGDITLEALGLNSALTNLGRLSTHGGDVTLRATGNIQIAGAINAGTGAVQMVSTVGAISNAGAVAPQVTGSTVSLTAGGGHIGAAGNAIHTHTTRLAVEGGGNIHAASDMTLTDLSVNALHVAPGTHTYQIDASGLSFTLTDGSTLSAAQIAQAGLNLTLLSDRSIELGVLDLGSGTLTVTSSAGNLTGAAGNLSTAASVVLTARGSNGNNGAIGTSVRAINTATPTLSATSGTGGAYLANTGALNLALLNTNGNSTVSATGTLTAGSVSAGTSALTLSSSGGSVVDDGNSATRIAAGTLSVNAAGAIGSAGTRLQTNASTLNANAGSGGIHAHTTATSSTLSNIVSGHGPIDITTGGTTSLVTVTSSTSGAGNGITIATTGNGNLNVGTVNAGSAGTVSLTTQNGAITSSGVNNVNADTLVARAGGSGAISLRSTAAHLDLAGASTIAVTQTGAVTLDNVATTGTSLTVTSSTGDITIGNVRTALGGSTTLSANGGAIVDDGNAATRLTTGSATLKATQSIGTQANPIQASIYGLTVDNTGHVHLTNSDNTLTSLNVTNRHATPGVANVLEITSPFLTFDVTDDGSRYALNRIVGTPLITLSFSGDQTSVIGQVQSASNGAVSLTATQGDLLEDGNAETRVTGNTVALTASQGHVGRALMPLEVNTARLTLTTRGDLYVNSLTDLSLLNISSSHADSTSAYGMVVKAPSLAFTVTDSAAGHQLQNVVDTSGLNFSFNSDRNLTVGQIDVAYSGGASLTSAGNIQDDGDKATRVLANTVTLDGSALGASGSAHLDVIAGTLNARATQGGIYIDLPTATGGNYTNTLNVTGVSAAGPVEITSHEGDISLSGSITATNQAVRLTAERGSILNPSGTVSVGNGSLTLNAAGSIGNSTRALTVNANGAALNAQAGTGIAVSTAGTLVLGTVNATPSGTVAITATSGSLLDDGNVATGITGSQVSLSAAAGALGSPGAALNVNAPRLNLTARNAVAVADSATLSELNLMRTAGASGTIGLTAGPGQTFDISGSGDDHTLATVSSASPLAFGFSGTGAVHVGTVDVGAAGSASLTSTGGNIASTGVGSSITAGTVALSAASGSVGSSTSAIALHGTTALSATSGRDLFVGSDAALANLALTSTNSSTGTQSQFGVTASGLALGLTDTGSTQRVDATGAGTFSFTSAKNLEVVQVGATGTVALATTGTGAASNISMASGSGRISGTQVSLSTAATGSTGGAIGASGTAMRVSTPNLLLNGRASMHVADDQNLARLDMTVSHGGTGTSSYGVTAGNITLNLNDGATQSLSLTTPGSIDFSYSTDRALSLGTIDAGTSSTGSVSLTSRSAPTGTNAQINHGSGTITAGSVSLSAVGSNGGVGSSGAISTHTQNLSVASRGNVSVNNSTALQSLNLDLRHDPSGSNIHNYSVVAGGSALLNLNDGTGTTGLVVNSINQAGLNLGLKTDRNITITNINTGTGNVTLTSTNSAGVTNGLIQGGSGASAVAPSITAGHLTLNAGNAYGQQNSGNPLYTAVDALSSNLTGSLHLSNNKSLTLRDNTVGDSARVSTTIGSILQGAGALFTTPSLTLSSTAALGATGNALQTHTRQLTLSAGRDIAVNNTTDLFGLDITSTHAAVGTQNTLSVTADRLDLAVTDSAGGNRYTLDHVTDASGINFRLTTDVDLVVGSGDVKPGHNLTLRTTGASILNGGNSTLKANSIWLQAENGSVGAAGDASSRMQTDARTLSVSTGASAFVDNAQDLLGLSFLSSQTNATVPTYSITAPELIFDITSDGTTTTVHQVRDTTGLNFALETRQAQVIDVVDVQPTGTVSLASRNHLLGSTNASHRITAASTTLSTNFSTLNAAIGQAGNEIRIASPLVTLVSSGSVNLVSERHIDRLGMTTRHPTNTAGTYRIDSVPVNGNTPYTLLAGTDGSTGTVLTSLTDTEGLDFTLSSDRSIGVGELNLGTTGTVTLKNSSGSIVGDGVAGTQVRAANLTMESATGAIGATGAGNSIEATVNALTATSNGGATYLNLHGRTSLGGVTANGAVNLSNDIGDIALGSINARGNAVTVDNQGGSILSGSISNTTSVTLTANGSIGNQAAVNLTANSGGTTTLSATAAAANGASGSINVSESHGLTATAISAPGAVTLRATNNLTVGSVSGGEAVGLTSTTGNLNALNGSNLVSGSRVALNASSHIGANGAPLRVSTKDLALRNVGNVHVQGQQDLDTLSMTRANDQGSGFGSGVYALTATNLTMSGADTASGALLTSIGDSTGLDFSFHSNGRIVVGGIDVGSGSLALRSTVSGDSGSISALSDATRVAAGHASLIADGANSSISLTGLAVGTLSASSGTGGLSLTQAGSLNLSNLSTTGNLSVTASTGDLTLGTMSYGSAHTLSLTASAGRILAGNVTLTGSSAASSINLSAAQGIGTELAPIIVNGAAGNRVSATVTGTGSLYLKSTGSLNGGLSTSVANGSTNITSANSILLRSMSSGTDAVGNDINVTASGGNITVENVSAGANARHSGVNLSANAGSILATGAGTVTGYDLNLFGAAGVGTNGNRIVVTGERVHVSTNGGAAYLGTGGASALTNVATNGGQINVSTAHDLLVANASSGGGAITVTGTAANVDLIAGNVNAGSGSVNFSSTSAGGTVQDDGSALTRITGGSVTLSGAAGVGSAAQAMQTTASSLNLSSSVGGIHLQDGNTNGVTLSSATAGGGSIVVNAAGPMTATTVTASADATGHDVTLTTASGNLTVGSVTAGATHGSVTLNAAGHLIGSGAGTHVTARNAQLTANGNIGTVTDAITGAGAALRLNVANVGGITATGNNRVVNLDNVNTGTWTLGAGGFSTGTGSAAYLRSAGNLDVSGASLPTDGHVLLSAAGTLTLPTAGLATTGRLRLTGTGDVVAHGATPRNLQLSGDSVYLRSGATGGDTTLATTTGSLDAALTGTGALTVNNTGTLTTTTLATSNGNISATSSTGLGAHTVTAGGANRSVSLTATAGDLTAGTVNAGASGTITLSAANGNLSVTPTNLTASTLNLTSHSAIGSSSAAFNATGKTVNAQVTGTGGIYLGSTGLLTLGNLSTADGDISATAASHLTANGTLSAGQSGNVALTSTGGNVTLAQAHTNAGADSSRAGLTVQGQTITLSGGSITTSGAQRYDGALVLTGNTTLTGQGVRFGGTVNGAYALTVNSGAGAANFVGAVGGTTRLGALRVDSSGATEFGSSVQAASVTTDAAGTLALHGGSVNTTGAQQYGERAVLGANTTLTGSTITLSQGADASTAGAQSLGITGNAVLGGAVGANRALSSLSVTGTSSLGGPVTTTGAQSYTGAATLTDHTTLSGVGVAFGSTVNGSHDLRVNAGTGAASFAGAIGGAQRLGALTVNSTGATSFNGSVRAGSVSTDAAGTLALNGGSVDTTGTQTYGERAVLGAHTTLTGSTITLAQGADASTAGAQSLGIIGNAVLGGATGANRALSSLIVTGTSSLGGPITTTGAQSYTGAATLTDHTTLSGVGMAFGSTVDGSHNLTVNAGTGAASFVGAIGGAQRLGALTVNSAGATSFNGSVRAGSVSTDAAGTLALNGGSVDTTGTQTYGERAMLGANTTLTGSTVTLSQGVDASTAGGQSLGITGNAVLGGATGANRALSSLTVTGTSSLGGDVTTTGAQTYSGATTLSADQTLTAGGGIAFGSTLDGAHALTLNLGPNDLRFDHAVGGNTRLGALVVHSSGETRLAAPIRAASVTTDAGGTLVLANTVDTTGAQSYGERAVLANDVTLTGSTITLSQGADGSTAGGQGLAIVGDAVIDAALGGEQALAQFTVSGNASLNGDVTTQGGQVYGGTTTLNRDTVLTGGAVNLNGAVNGHHALAVNSNGLTRFGGPVQLASLSTDVGGTLALDGGSVVTTGTQTYGERAMLGANTTLTGSTVTLSQGADASTAGAQSLGITGNAVLGGATGANQALASLTVSGTSTLGGDVTTTGAQTYGGASTLSANQTLTAGGGISFGSTLDGAHALTLNVGPNDLRFDHAVGGNTRLGALVVNSSGETRLAAPIRAASVTTDAGGTLVLATTVDTTGAQSYGERAVLANDVTLTGSTITLSQGADASTAGGQSLDITGNAVLGGATGANQALSSLSVTGTSSLGGPITTTGAQNYTGAATLTDHTTLSGVGVTFGSTVDGSHDLTVNAGTGAASFVGAIGGAQRLGALTVNSTGATSFNGSVRAGSVSTDAAGTLALNGGSVDTTGTQTYGERAVLGTNTTLTGSTVTLSQGVDADSAGAQSLAVQGNAVLGGPVGTQQALAGLSVSGSTALTGDVVTTGDQTYTGAVAINGDATLHSSGGSLVFGSTLDSASGRDVTLRADTGALEVAGDVGASGALGALNLQAGTFTTFNGSVRAGQIAQSAGGGLTRFGGDVLTQGAGGLVFNGHSVQFDGHVTAEQGSINLALTDAAGTATFGAGTEVQAATGFTQTGGAAVHLPASLQVTAGPISLQALAYRASGTTRFQTDGDITLVGLNAPTSVVQVDAGQGALKIGLAIGTEAERLNVERLEVVAAGSAELFGSIGGYGGVFAPSRINSSLVGSPFFMNGTPWGPIDAIATVTATTVPVSVVPSTPGAGPLFVGVGNQGGVAPNALAAYASPQVLTVMPSAAPQLQLGAQPGGAVSGPSRATPQPSTPLAASPQATPAAPAADPVGPPVAPPVRNERDDLDRNPQ